MGNGGGVLGGRGRSETPVERNMGSVANFADPFPRPGAWNLAAGKDRTVSAVLLLAALKQY